MGIFGQTTLVTSVGIHAIMKKQQELIDSIRECPICKSTHKQLSLNEKAKLRMPTAKTVDSKSLVK